MGDRVRKRAKKSLPQLQRLIKVVDRLRSPRGCPWDRKQTHASLKPHLIEEAYEVIDAEVIHQSATRMGISAPSAEIKARIASEKSAFPTDAEFHKSLAAQGITLDVLRKNMESQILIEKVTARLAKDISISDSEIQNFYDQNFDLFSQPERVHAYEIVLNDKRAINEVKARLNSGASIEAVVGEFSKGPSRPENGNMGILQREDVESWQERPLFDTPAGQLSRPVERGGSTILYWIAEKFPKQVTPIKEARPRIFEFIQSQKARTAFQAWLSRERKASHIDIGPAVKWVTE